MCYHTQLIYLLMYLYFFISEASGSPAWSPVCYLRREGDLELLILPPLPLECWDHRYELPHLTLFCGVCVCTRECTRVRECMHAGTATGGHLEFSITLCLVSVRQGLLMNQSLSVFLSPPLG